MSKKVAQPSAAWGLEIGGSALRLVRVERAASGWKVSAYHVALLPNRWQSSGDLAGAVAALRAELDHPIPAGEPLVLCIPDEAAMFRTLSLPRAEDSAFQQMVQAQMEVLLPAQSQMFAWGWDHDGRASGDGQAQRVWLCAARKDYVESAASAARRLGPEPISILPSAMALAGGFTDLFDESASRLLLVDIAARSTSVTILTGGKLTSCVVLDESADDWIEHLADQFNVSCDQMEGELFGGGPKGSESDRLVPGAPAHRYDAALESVLADWSAQLRQVCDDSNESLPRDQRPTRCVLLGRPRQTRGLERCLTQALGLEVQTMPRVKGDWSENGANLDAAPAVGAALSVLQSTHPAINLIGARDEAAPTKRRWVNMRLAVVVWLAAVVLGLYLTDLKESHWLAEVDARIKPLVGKDGRLERDLAVSSYLRQDGTPPLEILDEISRITPEKIIVTDWNYARRGTLRIKGTAPDAATLNSFLKALSEAKSIATVTPMSQQFDPKSKKTQFDIAATVADWVGPIAAPVAPDKEPSAATKGPKDSPPQSKTDEPAPKDETASPPKPTDASGDKPAPNEEAASTQEAPGSPADEPLLKDDAPRAQKDASAPTRKNNGKGQKQLQEMGYVE